MIAETQGYSMRLDVPATFEGYGLTTAEILYRIPDHPKLLQTYLWQEYDLAPAFPQLNKFLEFWKREIEGALHSVKVAHKRLVTPQDCRVARAEFLLN